MAYRDEAAMAYRDEAAMAYRDEAAMALLDSRLEVLIAFLLKIQSSNILLNTKTCISLVVEQLVAVRAWSIESCNVPILRSQIANLYAAFFI